MVLQIKILRKAVYLFMQEKKNEEQNELVTEPCKAYLKTQKWEVLNIH
jgi:hypothetical protein